jgi:hypothetical protein
MKKLLFILMLSQCISAAQPLAEERAEAQSPRLKHAALLVITPQRALLIPVLVLSQPDQTPLSQSSSRSNFLCASLLQCLGYIE